MGQEEGQTEIQRKGARGRREEEGGRGGGGGGREGGSNWSIFWI